MQAAVNLGPLAVAVDAGSVLFKFYKQGVFDHEEECGFELNHAINVVGYSNTDSDDTPYWIVRNSWGDDWGENGYIRIAIRDGYGVCGINLEPTFPNIYYLTVFDQSFYLALVCLGVLFSIWPLVKLSWCKSEELVFIHDGQKGLVRVASAMLAFYIVIAIVFAIAISDPLTLPSWMIYKSGIYILYAVLHVFICSLHF